MAIEVKLPKLGQTMEEGTIVKCLVKVGDKVNRGDMIFEVETDKATIEMESPANGFVKHIIAAEGQTFPVGDVVMIIGDEKEAVPAPAGAVPVVAAKKAQPAPAASQKPAAASAKLPDSAVVVKLPKLGQTMEEGTIVKCLVKVGEAVERGNMIFEIKTDKATIEMESPANGYVKHILVKEGQTLPVGDPVMILAGKDVNIPQSAIGSLVSAVADAPQQPEPAAAQSAPAANVQLPASAKIVNLPKLGQTMEEGTIVTSLIKVGDEIKRGAVIFEVETDKATIEMESPADGFVKAILVAQGQTVPVGDPVVILAGKDDKIPQAAIDSLKGTAKPAAASTPQPAKAAPAPTAPVTTPKRAGRIIASPRAKMLAKKLGVDLSAINGTGPHGTIVEKDVKAAPAAGVSAKPSKVVAPPPSDIKLGSVIPVNRLQKITAQRMLQSKLEIPCFYLTVKADVTELVKFRTKFNETSSTKISYNDYIIRAVATGLEHFPIMTGQLDGNNIKLADKIGIGLAISVPDGLVAPIVQDAGKKTVTEIAQYSKGLIDKARVNKLGPTDLEGGCITVSNLGAFGIESFIPVVVPGQCSILGIGQISDTCVPDDGGILIRKLMNMTLSVDHKVANGAYAAQFLDFVRKLLEDPAGLQ